MTLILLASWALVCEPPQTDPAIAALLDDWHKAAARADEKAYFGVLAEDSVFFGTDMKERWNKAEFLAYAKPFFDQGRGWNFTSSRRFIGQQGDIAWFDETLDTPNLGPARGTGVLRKEAGGWKIVQYHLCVPIPNEIFDQVKSMIAEHEKKEPEKKKE